MNKNERQAKAILEKKVVLPNGRVTQVTSVDTYSQPYRFLLAGDGWFERDGFELQDAPKKLNIKNADWVCCQDDPKHVGCVKRIAKDGSWVEVDWGPYVKRMRKPEILQVVTTLNLGHGVEITDMTREAELKAGRSK